MTPTHVVSEPRAQKNTHKKRRPAPIQPPRLGPTLGLKKRKHTKSSKGLLATTQPSTGLGKQSLAGPPASGAKVNHAKKKATIP